MRFNEFYWYWAAEERFFILLFEKYGDMDHAVCLDILRGLIFNSKEDYPVVLTE